MPNQYNIKQHIFKEFHDNPYAGHLGYHKFITALKQYFYWPNMKRKATEYVARCFTCQWVKAIHQHPTRLLQQIHIPKWNGLYYEITENKEA